MRFVTYLSPATGAPAPGVVSGESILGGRASSLIDVVSRGHGEALAWAQATLRDPVEVVSQRDATLFAPIPVPPSVRDFMSFEKHVGAWMRAIGRRVATQWYREPTFYFSNPAAICSATSDVTMSPGSAAFDFEVEVAAVIGAPGRDISAADAANHIAGFTVMVDWTSRDLQEDEMHTGLGPSKGKDGATSLGPYLVTVDELEGCRQSKGYDRTMFAAVNGRPYGAGNWADIYWSFEEMIAFASRGTELRPGDIIGSGTVGSGCILELARTHGIENYPYLQAGDEVVVAVEGLGAVISTVRPTIGTKEHVEWTK